MRTPIAFLINLDRDADRLSGATDRLQAAGLRFERIPGVLGTAVPHALADQFKFSIARMRPGEIGCYASHLLAAQRLIGSGREFAMVIEDDVSLEPGAAEIIAAAAAAAPVGWDFIGLCADSRRAMLRVADLPQGRALVRFSRHPWDVACYLLSRSGAKKLLAPRQRDCPFDLQMRQPWLLGINSLGVHPRIAVQIDTPSTIDALSGSAPRLVRQASSGLPGTAWYFRTLGPIGMLKCTVANVLRKSPKGMAGPVI